MESQQAKKMSISRRVINAIVKLQKNNGVSLVNLKKYLRDEKNLDVEKHNEEIKLTLKSGLDRDVLSRENGMYKVKGVKRGRDKGASTMRERSKSRQKSSKQESSNRKRLPSHLIRKKTPVKNPCRLGLQAEVDFEDMQMQKFRTDYKELLLSGKNSDFTINVKPMKFEVHKSILGARSPVFSAMMEHDMKEKHSGEVSIIDADPAVFKEFLLYLYTGDEEHGLGKRRGAVHTGGQILR